MPEPSAVGKITENSLEQKSVNFSLGCFKMRGDPSRPAEHDK